MCSLSFASPPDETCEFSVLPQSVLIDLSFFSGSKSFWYFNKVTDVIKRLLRHDPSALQTLMKNRRH